MLPQRLELFAQCGQEIDFESFYMQFKSQAVPLKLSHEPFLFCKNLASVAIPNSVTQIGDAAFSDSDAARCSSRVTIPDSVTQIGDCAFAGLQLVGKCDHP